MYIIAINHEYYHEMENIANIFYFGEKFDKVNEINEIGITFLCEVTDINITCSLYVDGICVGNSNEFINLSVRYTLKRCAYDLFYEYLKISQPWGMLTGVKPSKIVMKKMLLGKSDDEILTEMADKYRVSYEKTMLLIDVCNVEMKFINNDEINLYIGIPFCPSKCSYCSFTSFLGNEDMFDKYLVALFLEMDKVKDYVNSHKLANIYIGGGTPTALTHTHIETLLKYIQKSFDLSNIKEFTFEAGRPDTITELKLKVLKENNITRISINPQSLNDKTLELIGRKHTVSEYIQAYNMAVNMGFDNINVDLIIGLPKEDINDLKNTLEIVHKLKPQSLTIHTLTVKKGSVLKENISSENFDDFNLINDMMSLTREYAVKMGMKPYYLYRMKNMVGNFENIGYSVKGLECHYNMQIMEQKQSVIALGAGGNSKVLFNDRPIVKLYNPKDVTTYIGDIENILKRKAKFLG